MNIIETAIRRPVTVAMFTLATLVFGLVLLNRLGFNLLPELNYPTLTVRTEFEGAAPVEVENLISKPLEGVLGTIKGLRQVKSVSRAGQSDVYLEFYWGTNIDLASLDVREKLEQVELPLEVKSPSLLRFDPNNDPIIRMSLSQKSADKNTEQPANINNQATLSELRRYSDLQLTRRLETIEGVAAAKSSGGLKDEIQILIDQNKVAQFNLSLSDISQRLKTQNINMSGGQIINGQRQLLVRTFNEYQSIEDFSNTIILSESQKVVRLKDIADVKFSHKDPTAVIRHNGEQSVEIAIYKEGDANTVQVADAVKSRLDGLKKQLPENMQLTLLTDSSIFIKQSIDELVSAAVWGGLLAMLVIYLFLGSIRSTIIISATIPLSVIVTFNLMYTAKVDINIMSLGGLALAVGMLVDNAIVVLENIAKKREQGLSLAQSSYEGASEVSGAITASTLTTIAVFLPLIFVEGIAGQLFRDQALTITFSLLVSLAIALTVIPTMAAKRQIKSQDDIVLQRSEKPLWKRILLLPIELLVFFITAILEVINLIGLFFKFLLKLLQPLRSVFDNLFGRLETFYHRLLTASLQQQFKTISIAMAMLIASLLILGQRPQVVLPEMAQGQFIAKVKYTPGTSIEVTDKKVVELSRQLLAIEGVNEVFATAGSGNKLTANPEQEGNNQAEFSLLLDKSLSKNQEDQLLIQIRQVIAENTQGTNTEIDRPKLFSFSTPLSVELYGYDLDNLKKAAQRVSKSLAESPRFIDIQSNMQKGYPEAQITFDQEKMAYLGLSIEQSNQMVVNSIRGNKATRYRLKEDQIDVLVRLKDKDRNEFEDIRNLIINPTSDKPIPLHAVASIIETQGPSEIMRVDQQRVVVIEGQLNYGGIDEAIAEARQILDEIQLPIGTHYLFGGQSEEMERSYNSLFIALALAVFLVYLVMASQFESLLHPFIILLSIPLASVGVALILWLTNTELSVIVFLGLIMLAGIVVNNAIVLIDKINQLRLEGVKKHSAIIQAAEARLRPILMTTLTTTLGMLPLALGMGEGSEIRAPMAITVIGGLLISTLLTLIVIPVMYQILDRKDYSKTITDRHVNLEEI